MKKSITIFFSLLALIIGCYFILKNILSSEKLIDENKTVYIKKNSAGYQIYRNGTPFYINGASGNSHLNELARIGGNTIRVYDTINLKKVLNDAEKNGLAVIVDIPIPRYNEKYNSYRDPKFNDLLKKKIKILVEKYNTHPALLMWNLGNEIEYPFVFKANDFIDTFNELIDIIHEADQNHPIGTSIPSINKKQLFSIYFHSPNIDIIAFNIFGNIKNLDKELSKVTFFTGAKPYYISEWGYDGPWECSFTSWGAPIEPTSTKKREQLISRYKGLKKNINNDCVGTLFFFWGIKQESTHTWFSLFLDMNSKSEIIEELKNLWQKPINDKNEIGLDYMLLNEKGSLENLVFSTNEKIIAEIVFNQSNNTNIQIEWEIYPESWSYNKWDIEKRPKKIAHLSSNSGNNKIIFTTSNREGPYRIFAYIFDDNGKFASTNIPFYILKPE
tara:strand:+ start:306 stop:1637 length:1332 start_codon:yes stop_codon:yes gene_type:complete